MLPPRMEKSFNNNAKCDNNREIPIKITHTSQERHNLGVRVRGWGVGGGESTVINTSQFPDTTFQTQSCLSHFSCFPKIESQLVLPLRKHGTILGAPSRVRSMIVDWQDSKYQSAQTTRAKQLAKQLVVTRGRLRTDYGHKKDGRIKKK